MVIEVISVLLTMAAFFVFKRNDGCLGLSSFFMEAKEKST
jgi:hypothetical protein